MLNSGEAEKLLLEEKEEAVRLEKRKQRIDEAIDVSPALNNCFFHAYALHLLSNQHAFPPGLFDLTEFDGTHVVTLKERLHDDRVLQEELTTAATPDYLFEKTLILGILLRSWFCTQLFHSETARDALFEFKGETYNGDIRAFTFLRMVSEYQDALFTPVLKARSLVQDFKNKLPTLQQLLDLSVDVPNNVFIALKQLPNIIEASIATLETDEKNSSNPISPLEKSKQVLKKLLDVLDDAQKELKATDTHELLNDFINEAKAELNFNLAAEQQNFVRTFERKYEDFPIYLGNKAFFNEALANTDLESIKTYWHKEGYENFCRFLNLSNTKISYADVDPILANLVPYAIYSENGAVLVCDTIPFLELMLKLNEGHYKLLTNPRTIELLQHYPLQQKHYLQNREALLAQKRVAEELIKETLFVEALIPEDKDNNSNLVEVLLEDEGINSLPVELFIPENNKVNPLDALIKNLPKFLDKLKEKMGRTPQTEEVGPSTSGEQKEHLPSETPESPIHSGDGINLLSLTEVGEQRDPLSVSVGVSTSEIQEHPDEVRENINPENLNNAKLQHFYQQLVQLEQKAKEFKAKENQSLDYKRAAEATGALYDKLHRAFNDFVKNPNEKAFELFSQQSLAAIQKHQPALERHRKEYGQLKQIIGNIVLAIVGIGIFYGAALMINRAVNGRYFFFAPKTAQDVSKIEKMIPEIAPENKSTF
ncbi:hypothetical protein [Legionella clemsonensis]|uniref:Dot/Icm secretion system substrate n=1 Tax=Legionella clemsonensis TaxID=1867846 RepID=A0A222P2U0_9GAMM|nr:hypothetical protein [Legionella clemsonensis]ASQ46149.1 hypothetical protein clem_07985 [Legionella clemsonensis]